jgi:hypothetical protein
MLKQAGNQAIAAFMCWCVQKNRACVAQLFSNFYLKNLHLLFTGITFTLYQYSDYSQAVIYFSNTSLAITTISCFVMTVKKLFSVCNR